MRPIVPYYYSLGNFPILWGGVQIAISLPLLPPVIEKITFACFGREKVHAQGMLWDFTCKNRTVYATLY